MSQDNRVNDDYEEAPQYCSDCYKYVDECVCDEED